MTMADTVAVMNAGRIEQMGPPAELYDLPRTAFVANFLGQSNLVRGTVGHRATATSWPSGPGAGKVVRARGASDRPRPGTSSSACGPRRCGSRRRRAADRAGDNVIGPGTVIDVSLQRRQHPVHRRRARAAAPGRVFAQNLGVDAARRAR